MISAPNKSRITIGGYASSASPNAASHTAATASRNFRHGMRIGIYGCVMRARFCRQDRATRTHHASRIVAHPKSLSYYPILLSRHPNFAPAQYLASICCSSPRTTLDTADFEPSLRLPGHLLDHPPPEVFAQGLELLLLLGVEQRLELLVEGHADLPQPLDFLQGAERGVFL